MKKTLTLAVIFFTLAAYSQNALQKMPGFNYSPKDEVFFSQPKLEQISGSQQFIDSIYVWRWDNNSESWKLESKTIEFEYNALNSVTSSLFQAFNGSTWNDHSLNTYIYDANNNCINSTLQVWAASKWQNTYLYTSTYDANNNELNLSVKTWNGSEWSNAQTSIRTYDASNKLTSRIEQYWNSSNFINTVKIEYSYDENRNCIKQLIFAPVDANEWKITSQTLFSYNASNILTEEVTQSWDGSSWTSTNKTSYNIDNSNNITSYLSRRWDNYSWLNVSLTTQTWNTNNLLLSKCHKSWNANSLTFTNQDSTYNYYHPIATEVAEFEKIGIEIFPNPTNGKFNIKNTSSSDDIDQLEIIDIAGRCMRSELHIKPQTTIKIDISDLPKSFYLIKTRSGIKSLTKKILVQ